MMENNEDNFVRRKEGGRTSESCLVFLPCPSR